MALAGSHGGKRYAAHTQVQASPIFFWPSTSSASSVRNKCSLLASVLYAHGLPECCSPSHVRCVASAPALP